MYAIHIGRAGSERKTSMMRWTTESTQPP